MQWLYLGSLVFSISGLLFLDWQHKIAFFSDTRRTIKTIAPVFVVLLVWDVVGVALGIFFHGGSAFTLPLRILPEVPIEELFFLFLLCYVTLLVYIGWERRCSPTL